MLIHIKPIETGKSPENYNNVAGSDNLVSPVIRSHGIEDAG